MSPFNKELINRIQGIKNKSMQIQLRNSFSGRMEFKNEIDRLSQMEEFKNFFSNWKYKSKIIFNKKLWKSHKEDFFNLPNSYFLLNTKEELLIFKQFLEKQCLRNIQQQKTSFSSDEILYIYEKFLDKSNPKEVKDKAISSLKDVLKNNIKASQKNILFLTKELKVDGDKNEWYKKLGLSNDQVSIIYNRNLLCKAFPKYSGTIMTLAVNKFKIISHKQLSKDIQFQVLKQLQKNPKMTKKQIESKVNSYKVFDENMISNILNQLKSSWLKLDSKTKKDISFQLHKIQERIKQ